MTFSLKDYHQALQTDPGNVQLHYHLGLFFLKQSQWDHAKTQFNNVLALHPEHLQAWFYLGALHLRDETLGEATRCFENALIINDEHVQSMVNLGVIALKEDRGQAAIDHFTRALALDEHNLEAQNNLAATFMHHDRFEQALTHYHSLLKIEPHNAEYLYNAGVANMALGALNQAVQYFETLLTHANPYHAATYNNLAAIQLRLGHRSNAMGFLQQALHANPHDESSQFMLAALTDTTHPTQTCTTYVTHLFDNYALHYDQHLKQTLQYTLPEHIMKILHQLPLHHVTHTLDLGCGTGLCGMGLRELSQHLHGVDLSAKMLQQARQKNLYDQLTHAELSTFLTTDTQAYDLIVAADVLPYMGELNTLFTHVRTHLKPQGYFVFNIELSTQSEWQLQDSIRFGHHPDYIHRLCKEHGLQIHTETRIPARQQHERMLEVMLYVMTDSRY